MYSFQPSSILKKKSSNGCCLIRLAKLIEHFDLKNGTTKLIPNVVIYKSDLERSMSYGIKCSSVKESLEIISIMTLELFNSNKFLLNSNNLTSVILVENSRIKNPVHGFQSIFDQFQYFLAIITPDSLPWTVGKKLFCLSSDVVGIGVGC